ncbi:MAG: sulfotransferase family protein [Candidatus Helarchaeota archaeon]
MKKPIFILGIPRSGSTLWLRILQKNNKLIGFDEMHYLNPWHKDFRYFIKKYVKDVSINSNIKKMIDVLFSKSRIVGLKGQFWSELKSINDNKFKKYLYNEIINSDRSLEKIFKILVEELTNYKQYSRCIIKFPVYLNYIDKLIKWYPYCKIIHVTRDPRAIAISKTNDPGGIARKIRKFYYLRFFIRKIMILFVIVQYIWSSMIHVRYKNLNNYSLFKYEDLLNNPEKTIKKLCEFCEIDYFEEMLNPEEGQPSTLTGKKSSGFNKASAYRWKQYISPIENKIVILLLKKSREKFGYKPD